MTSPHRGIVPPSFATPAERLVHWPERFGRRFIVTIDTEEEFDWRRPPHLAAKGVSAIAALPAFHDRLAGAGVHPVYMVDYPVADDAGAAAVLRDILSGDADAAIGAQLHSWVTPPFADDAAETFAGNLPPALEAAKITALADRIERALGVRPRLFRSGRYGIGRATAAALVTAGFVADASMRARFDYRDEGGPDFTRVGNAAFRLAERLTELPLTTIYTGKLRGRSAELHPMLGRIPRGRGIAARFGLLSRTPLTPEGVSQREALAAIRAADGEVLLQIAFHSPSLVPGHTPYVRRARDLARFHAWWDVVLPALADAGYAPATLADVLAACQREARAAT